MIKINFSVGKQLLVYIEYSTGKFSNPSFLICLSSMIVSINHLIVNLKMTVIHPRTDYAC